MSAHDTRSARLALLLGALAATACGDSPVTPDELGAAQTSTAAMFAEIIGKLESIEQRIDSLEATVNSTGGGGLVLTGLPAEQLDSLLDLTSFMARDAFSGSWEACGEAQLGLEFGLEISSEVEGKGDASLGAWAGTGAFVGGEAKATGQFGGSLKVDGSGGVEFCYPLGGGDPPARPAPAGPQLSPELDQMRTALTNLTTQFNLTHASLAQSISGVGTALASPGSLGLTNIGSHLPLPAGMSSIAADPMGAATSRVQGFMTTAQSSLCSSGGWGPNVTSIIAEACNIINAGGLANFTAFADMASTYPVVQSAVTNACTRVNTMGLQRLVIPSWDVTFPLGIGTVEVFPGYNQRIFPAYTSFACP